MDSWLFFSCIVTSWEESPDFYSVPSCVASGSHHTPISHKSKSPAQVVFLIRDPQAHPAKRSQVKPLSWDGPIPPRMLPLLLGALHHEWH